LLFKRLNEALAMELICMLRYKRHRRLQCFRAYA
jgi:bacterioferritin (cytochrome b1)